MLETYKIKQRILEHALSASAGVFYNINITRNRVPGTMVQVLNGVEYDINKKIGFPDNCKYTDVVNYWGSRLTKEQQPAYFAFFDLKHLENRFRNNENHISHQYWTRDVLGNPMLAEQHIIMYEDLLNGDIVGITYVLDLTNLDTLREKEAEQRKELEIALKKAEIANDFKTNFLFNISHDIRTPMNAIIGYAALAATRIDQKERVADYLKKITQSSSHLLSLINNVLDMSRIESGKVVLNESEENLAEILHDLRAMVQPQINAKQIDFFIDTCDVKDELIERGVKLG